MSTQSVYNVKTNINYIKIMISRITNIYSYWYSINIRAIKKNYQ